MVYLIVVTGNVMIPNLKLHYTVADRVLKHVWLITLEIMSRSRLKAVNGLLAECFDQSLLFIFHGGAVRLLADGERAILVNVIYLFVGVYVPRFSDQGPLVIGQEARPMTKRFRLIGFSLKTSQS